MVDGITETVVWKLTYQKSVLELNRDLMQREVQVSFLC